jgi:hypothetical protein
MKYRNVTKEEFDKFVAAYPRPLVKDVCGIPQPPVLSYNDFSMGKWPESIVAQVQLFESGSKDEGHPYPWEPNTYSLLNP